MSEVAGLAASQIDEGAKDWTWILGRPCDQCGLDATGLDISEIIARAQAATGEWVQILTSHPAVTRRPDPRVWSALEYGAHVRDICLLFDARLALMLVEDDPIFDAWDQDEVAESDAYAEQDPDRVAEQLSQAVEALLARIAALEPSQWDRPGRRSDGAEFTVITFVRYYLHEMVHHLWDVTAQPDAASSLS